MALAAKLHLVFNGSEIEGPETDKSIRIDHFRHEVKSERNPTSGKVIGPRHGLFLFRKRVDETTPIFHQMLQQKERKAVGNRIGIILRQLAQYSSSSQHGGEQSYMAIMFSEVQVVSIETVMPDYAVQATKFFHEYEDIQVAYKDATWRGLVPNFGGEVKVFDVTGRFVIDWAWQYARVSAAKWIASKMKGKDDEEKDDKKKDPKKDDKDK